jgi:pteridine reductase
MVSAKSSMPDDLPVALVTGASQRLGATIARALHARGHRVAVHYHRSQAPAHALCAELQSLRADSAGPFAADLADRAACEALVPAVLARWGRLDVLVNNAAVFRATPTSSSAAADWDEIAHVNLRAPYILACAAADALRARDGLIVNLADVYAERPRAGFVLYCVSKAGLVGLTRALAREFAPLIRVNAIAPGAILWSAEAGDAERAAILARTPLARLGAAGDIAGAVCYLLDAPYVTGQVISVDGGRSIYD